jgi:hypothetical protein
MNAAKKAFILGALFLVAFAGCKRGPGGFVCPGQFDPSHKSTRELKKLNIASIPRQEATKLAEVKEAEQKSRRFIRQNYQHVIDIGVGRGWGVNYTQDRFGNVSFHHVPDYMVVVVVAEHGDCPDPERGTLFVFGYSGLRVPARFLFAEKD